MVDFNEDDLPGDDMFVQPGDAQRDAIRVGDVFVGAPLSAAQLADQAEAIKLAALQAQPREKAIERGRLAGEDEARNRGETGVEADNRVRRAMAYAAWEHDGKPLSYGDRYHSEFNLGLVAELHSHLRHKGPDLKKGKK